MKMRDEEYYSLKILSYSKLTRFYRLGPLKTFTTEEEDLKGNRNVIIGSVVDDIITNEKEVKQKYHTAIYTKPTASLGDLVDMCIAAYESLEKCTVTNVLLIAKSANLWSNIKNNDTYISKFDIPMFWNYLKEYYQSKDKIIVDKRDMELAEAMAQTLINDVDTKDAFVESENIEILYQEAMLWRRNAEDGNILEEIEDTPEYKSKFDVLRIDHKGKTVQFIDIKTMKAPVTDFIKSFYNFQYYIQDAMYQDALIAWRNKNYPDYDVLDPYNIVISQSDPYKAYKFEIDPQWLVAGKYGYMAGNKQIPGYLELTEQYNWHKENKIYNYTKDEFYNGRKKTIEFTGQLNV